MRAVDKAAASGRISRGVGQGAVTWLGTRSILIAARWTTLLALLLFSGPARAQEVVGRIEGDTFTASGQVRVEHGAGHNATTLLSGSEVVVHEGHARLVLADGSEVDICGPAKIALLKSGGAVTLALDYGRVHGRLAPSLPITVYTALATATPVAIGSSQRDIVVGLEQQGSLCVNAVLGAVRLEHQFTGEKLLAPQGAEISVAATSMDSIRTSPGTCRCDAPPQPVLFGVAKEQSDAAAKQPEPKPAEPSPETGRRENAATEKPAREREEPRVIAVMPPLTFDANAPAPPVPAQPEVVRIIREVRVQPATVFTGRVAPREKPGPAAATAANENAKAGAQGQTSAQTKEKKPGFGARLKGFFARLFGRKPKT